MHALTIGIAGGTGSGKTTVANQIIEKIGKERIAILEQDSFYKDLADLPSERRIEHNFDHPSSVDFDLFKNQIETLKSGKPVEKPVYDFHTHSRLPKRIMIEPRPVLIVEGILIFDHKDLRDLLDVKIFVETPADIRFIRRLTRDIKERGRDIHSVIKQYYTTVRPMHLAFVEPCRELADIIIPWQGYNNVAVDMVISKIKARLD